MRNVKRLGLAMLVAHIVAAGPVVAEDGKQNPPERAKADGAEKAAKSREKAPTGRELVEERRKERDKVREGAAGRGHGTNRDESHKARGFHQGRGLDPKVDALDERAWGLRKKSL